MKKFRFLVGIVIAIALMIPTMAFADQPERLKLDVCHATGSASNPYVLVNVNISSVEDAQNVGGHGNHENDSWDSYTYGGVDYPGQGDMSNCSEPEPTEPPPTDPPPTEPPPTEEPPCEGEECETPTPDPCDEDPESCETPVPTPTPPREREDPPAPPKTGGGWELILVVGAGILAGVPLYAIRRRGK